MQFAVLMTCHNRREKTLQCLDSLTRAAQECFNHHSRTSDYNSTLHVFINDDGSTDGTREALQEWHEENDPLSTSTVNLCLARGSGSDYWARGMARAWQAALDYEKEHLPSFQPSNPPILKPSLFSHFLWLNDDVVLKPDALLNLLSDSTSQRVTTNPQRLTTDDYPLATNLIVGACSTDESETASSYSATTRRDEQIVPNGRPQLADGWFNGNCVLVPRCVYEKVGMIDGAYSHARADYDYAERLKKAGIPFYCSSQFVGVCKKDINEKIRDLGLFSRCKMLVRPGYLNLHDMWRYRIRHYGVIRALASCAHLIKIAIGGWE